MWWMRISVANSDNWLSLKPQTTTYDNHQNLCCLATTILGICLQNSFATVSINDEITEETNVSHMQMRPIRLYIGEWGV